MYPPKDWPLIHEGISWVAKLYRMVGGEVLVPWRIFVEDGNINEWFHWVVSNVRTLVGMLQSRLLVSRFYGESVTLGYLRCLWMRREWWVRDSCSASSSTVVMCTRLLGSVCRSSLLQESDLDSCFDCGPAGESGAGHIYVSSLYDCKKQDPTDSNFENKIRYLESNTTCIIRRI